RGDLDDHVARRVESGHLQIHPDEHARRLVGWLAAQRWPPRGDNDGVLRIPVVRLDADLPLPGYARAGDAGADLVARESVTLRRAGGRGLVGTGIALAIPEGYAGFVQPRSGLALRHGVTCLNTPGLIDSGYRDELKVLLVNTDPDTDYEVRRGDRIAQLVVQRIEHAEFAPEATLDDSARGTGGFGHTGR
ncbi:MAG: dUTP diphosphatase, partial [Candidatus Limnocylindrales bacterium]